MVSDLTYIDFQNNWAEGLNQLVKALGKADTPRPLSDGCERVVASVIPPELILPGTERLYSNLFPVLPLPNAVITFEFLRCPRAQERATMGREWAGYRIDEKRFVAFQQPPSNDDFWRHKVIDAHIWREKDNIHGIATQNVISHLLKKSLRVFSLSKGMQETEDGNWLHIPRGLLNGDRQGFVGLDGRKTWISVTGTKGLFRPGKKTEEYHYYLAPSFLIRQDLSDDFIVVMSIRVHIADSKGKTYPPRSAQARRKAATAAWWNWEWGNRHLAMAHFLSNGQSEIVIGARPQEAIHISAVPLTVDSPFVINEAEVVRRRKERAKQAKEGAK
jgi:hypothetical protein